MFHAVDTKDASAVEREVEESYRELYADSDPQFVPRAFRWLVDCFAGRYRDFQAIDVQYHDLEHTLQGTLCMGRLLTRYQRAGAVPALDRRRFELGLLAILLHDSGYLKKRGDHLGTGAKYTFTHVARSVEFGALLLAEKGFSVRDIRAVQNMIRCTGLNVELAAIPFDDELDRVVGYALGTSDLVGQMAAPDYVDKLPMLFSEFDEARAHERSETPDAVNFSDAEDLMRQTPAFWRNYVLDRITREFRGLFHYLDDPYPGGRNEYVERVEANLTRLVQVISAAG